MCIDKKIIISMKMVVMKCIIISSSHLLPPTLLSSCSTQAHIKIPF